MGFNNIELITDRPLEVNLREIREVKRRFPKHAVVVSLMTETKHDWHTLIRKVEDTGCDGLELNFGCPHGMCERGMGSSVGQEPKLITEITRWVKEVARTPVLVKLTPNTGDMVEAAQAAQAGGADGVSLINTIKSLMGVDLERMVPNPRVGRRIDQRRLLRPGREAHRAAHGRRPSRATLRGLPHLGHRRHLDLARRGRVHRPRLDERAGVHRRHAPTATASWAT